VTKTNSQKAKHQRLVNFFRVAINFLGKRYAWLGLLCGFLWSFSAPFILYTLSSANLNFPQHVINIFFFPMVFALLILNWIAGYEGYIDVFLLWMFSIVIGMSIGVVVTYSVHRIRILMQRRKGT